MRSGTLHAGPGNARSGSLASSSAQRAYRGSPHRALPGEPLRARRGHQARSQLPDNRRPRRSTSSRLARCSCLPWDLMPMDSFGQLRTWRRPDSMLDVTDTVAVWRPTENGMEGRASQVSLRTRKRGLIAGREVHCAPCNRGEDPISSRTPIALFLRKMPAPISRMSEDQSCPHTCQPRRASRIAVASPAMPAPTISARRPPRAGRILSGRGSLSATLADGPTSSLGSQPWRI